MSARPKTHEVVERDDYNGKPKILFRGPEDCCRAFRRGMNLSTAEVTITVCKRKLKS